MFVAVTLIKIVIVLCKIKIALLTGQKIASKVISASL